jgi:hypothetical protein
MESTYLIKNNNQALNILPNLYGNDWWIDFISKGTTFDVNFHEREIRYCKITGCQAIAKEKETYDDHIREYHEERNVGR